MVENVMGESAEHRTAIEARSWLTDHPDLFLADHFGLPDAALRFVDSLYQAGSPLVSILLKVGWSGPAGGTS
jgi:hypothetical protein